MYRFALLAVVVVALAAAMSLPAIVEASGPRARAAHTMSCRDAYRALGRWRSTANVAWWGCKGVGGAWLRLIVLGRSGRVYSWTVHHFDNHCWVGTLCDRHYDFY